MCVGGGVPLIVVAAKSATMMAEQSEINNLNNKIKNLKTPTSASTGGGGAGM